MAINGDGELLTTLRANLLEAAGKKLNSLEVGSLVGEDYVLGPKVNEGGSGAIYKCHLKDDQNRIFALKVCVPKSANAARRFQAEVTASYAVKHPNVLRSIDCFFHGEALTYIMEYAPGGDLRDILDKREVVPISTVVILARQLCSGLAAIHESGIIHRDIKPENVLFSSDGQVKIADFGISFTTEVSRVTANGSLVGTVNYMAPEYVQKGIFDGRSDLYSLGVLLYELVSGELPLGYSKTLEELIERIHKGFQPVHKRRADCPIKLSNIISRLLAIDPNDRFQSASEIELELAALEKEVVVSFEPEDEEIESMILAREVELERGPKRFDIFGLAIFICVILIISSLSLLTLKSYDLL